MRSKRGQGAGTELAEPLSDAVWIVCVSHYSTQKLPLESAATCLQTNISNSFSN